MFTPVLRVARPTNDLDALLPFYRDGLGFIVLSSFQGHDGFDGCILGHVCAPYHLEFTRQHGETAEPAPSHEHLLVLYLPDTKLYQAGCARMKNNGFEAISASNPYWNKHGTTFEDPDGYRTVLCHLEWAR